MANLREPPFLDPPNPNNKFWSESWREWLRDLWAGLNKTIYVAGSVVANNFAKFNSDGAIVDSGKAVPTGDVVGTTDTQTLTNKSVPTPTSGLHIANKNYVDDSVEEVTGDSNLDDTLPEAGTESGYHIGNLLIEGDCIIKQEEVEWTISKPFPVGAIYMNTTGVDPNTELGYGTWQCLGVGDLTLT